MKLGKQPPKPHITKHFATLCFSALSIHSLNNTHQVHASEPEPQTINIATIDWCPQICPTSGEKPGYLIEITEKIFPSPQYKIRYNITSWSRAIANVEKGVDDILLSPSKAEAPNLLYHQTPIAKQAHCFYSLKSNPWRYEDISSLQDLKLIIYDQHSYQDLLKEYLDTNPPDLIKMPYTDSYISASVKMLKRDRADAFLFTRNSVRYYLTNSGETQIQEGACIKTDDLWLALSPVISPKRDKLLEHINASVRDFVATPDYQALILKYGIN